MDVMVLTERAIERFGSAAAAVDRGNLLASPPALPAGATRLVAWSGWMGEADPALGRFERDVRTWGPAAWAGLMAACDRLLPVLNERGAELVLRPHARHVLSDPQRCLAFLKARAEQPIRILLDPMAFLTRAMLARAEDHLERSLGALAGHPGVWGVVVSNVQRVGGEEDDQLVTAPLDRGLVDPALIAAACRRNLPPALPRVVLAGDAAAEAMLRA